MGGRRDHKRGLANGPDTDQRPAGPAGGDSWGHGPSSWQDIDSIRALLSVGSPAGAGSGVLCTQVSPAEMDEVLPGVQPGSPPLCLVQRPSCWEGF